MSSSRGKRKKDRCTHTETVIVRTAGLDREICERCGHVSVNFLEEQLEPAERDQFARVIEREDV